MQFWRYAKYPVHIRPVETTHDKYKAVIDRRRRPLGSYFKRLKSSPVRPLTCNWYYCAQFIAKPKAAGALRFS